MPDRLLDEIVNLLSEQLPDIRFVKGFAAEGKETPLKKVTVAVEVSSAEFAGGPLGGFLGCNDRGREIFGKLMRATIGFRIFVPLDFEGADCLEVFAKIAEKMYASALGGFCLESVYSRGLYYDRINGAKAMSAGAVFTLFAGDEEGE